MARGTDNLDVQRIGSLVWAVGISNLVVTLQIISFSAAFAFTNFLNTTFYRNPDAVRPIGNSSFPIGVEFSARRCAITSALSAAIFHSASPIFPPRKVLATVFASAMKKCGRFVRFNFDSTGYRTGMGLIPDMGFRSIEPFAAVGTG